VLNDDACREYVRALEVEACKGPRDERLNDTGETSEQIARKHLNRHALHSSIESILRLCFDATFSSR
jgi:hypothetical protein